MAEPLPFSPTDELLEAVQGREVREPVLACWILTITQTVAASAAIAFVDSDRPHTVRVPRPDRLGGGTQDVIFSPIPCAFDRLETPSDGSLPSVQLTIANTMPQVTEYLIAGSGLSQMPCYCFVVPASRAMEGVTRWWEFRVDSPSANSESVSLRLDAGQIFDLQLPQDRIGDGDCGFTFKDPETCAYVGPETHCGGSYEECVAFGDTMVAAGRPRLHPQRWGGKAAMPR